MNKSSNKESGTASGNEKLRETVGESFNIYQASLAMVGFVLWAVRFLIFAMIALSLALACLHGTAHKVVMYWKIFFPVSRLLQMGFIAFILGLVFMFLTVIMLLFDRKMTIEAWIVIGSTLFIVFLLIRFRRMHKDASYMINVD